MSGRLPGQQSPARTTDVGQGTATTIKVVTSLCLLSIGISYWTLSFPRQQPANAIARFTEANDDEFDARLQLVAAAAIGEREGAIVVIDPQTGRVRALVNPALAFQHAFPPGSTVKPFTALAALRAELIDGNSRTGCREQYRRGEFVEVCSHRRDLGPLNPTEAIAYSCNYYFAKLGERLPEVDLGRTLTEFGFGHPTGINSPEEANGALVHAKWQPQSAIGEGDYLQVTPIQLLTAYAALLNRGRLLRPQIGVADHFTPEVRAQIAINDEERAVIFSGMRGAVRYGTAESAQLYSLPWFVVGKTGTSTPLRGFRTQGWFVGLAFAEDGKTEPTEARLGVVVYLKRSHGSEAAQLARSIFEEFGKRVEAVRHTTQTVNQNNGVRQPPATHINVHQVTENITRLMLLEDYVLGVVSTEGSLEDEPEALKALAIAVRTYALGNLRRHVEQGYDFCSTTHCQRFTPPRGGGANLKPREVLVAAVEDTAGLVLRDDHGRIAESYFGASCGGMTANLQSLWGARAPDYLRGVRDEYCSAGAHHRWTDTIAATKLAIALRSNPRTDVGQTVRELTVTRMDDTGRAELISLAGQTRRTISGWEFKLIVGRALGWNVLKSSRFTVSRSGPKFVFRGSGFGHGLGLCQEGSHVMAQRGFSFRQILGKYFPGTTVGAKNLETGRMPNGETGLRQGRGTTLVGVQAETNEARGVLDPMSDLLMAQNSNPAHADLLWKLSASPHPSLSTLPFLPVSRFPSLSAVSRRHTLVSEHFRLDCPATVKTTDAEALLRLLESSRTALSARLSAANVAIRFPRLEIFLNETTGDFVGRTGQPWWVAAATRNQHIEFQPLELLKRRRILETTVRHELVHVVIDEIGSNQTPRWLAEGMALYISGEGKMIQRYNQPRNISRDELDKTMAQARTAEEMQAAYAVAYDAVRTLVQLEGETSVWRRVAGLR